MLIFSVALLDWIMQELIWGFFLTILEQKYFSYFHQKIYYKH